jgi:geranylgeranyl diphosphate synthase type II
VSAAQTIAGDLERYSELVSAKLDTYLPEDDAGRAPQIAVHRSMLRRGKALRPAICLATCAAFRAAPELALTSAAAIELVHNAFLVHDDIQDGSEFRRGRPTLHRDVGVPLAINAGDALAVLSLRPLLESAPQLGSALTERLLREFHHTIATTIEGQAIELSWRQTNLCDLTVADYLAMVLRKTCCYSTIHPLRVGAIVATRGRVELAGLTEFGFYLGSAFQIRDDILDLVTSTPEYGKDVWGDLYEGKRTLPIVHLLSESTPSERRELVRLLGGDRRARDADAVAWIRGLMDEYGSIDFARSIATGIAELAADAFTVAFAGVPPSRDRDFLAALPEFVVERAA